MIERTLFSEDHNRFRDSFRRFLEKEVVPFHADWEEQGYADREVWRKAENGFLCMSMPDEFGGSGAATACLRWCRWRRSLAPTPAAWASGCIRRSSRLMS
jgi:alkylation response protein AidB-like acyl-CoA dehydrogenase